MAKYKQRCVICKNNWALTSGRQQPVCENCERELLRKPIGKPEMKKMFDIDPKFYQENYFLRSIRLNYARYGSLTQKQIDVFKKVVDDLKNPKPKEPPKPK